MVYKNFIKVQRKRSIECEKFPKEVWKIYDFLLFFLRNKICGVSETEVVVLKKRRTSGDESFVAEERKRA